MVWCIFSSVRVKLLARLNGVNAYVYQNLSQQYSVHPLRAPPYQLITVMQDNAPCHTAKRV